MPLEMFVTVPKWNHASKDTSSQSSIEKELPGWTIEMMDSVMQELPGGPTQ